MMFVSFVSLQSYHYYATRIGRRQKLYAWGQIMRLYVLNQMGQWQKPDQNYWLRRIIFILKLSKTVGRREGIASMTPVVQAAQPPLGGRDG